MLWLTLQRPQTRAAEAKAKRRDLVDRATLDPRENASVEPRFNLDLIARDPVALAQPLLRNNFQDISRFVGPCSLGCFAVPTRIDAVCQECSSDIAPLPSLCESCVRVGAKR